MLNKRFGRVIQILNNDNIGILKESKTNEEFIFFLDEISRYEHRAIVFDAEVAFIKDETFEYKIATNLISIQPLRKAI